VPEYTEDYPEPFRFGVMPSWALWARHAKNLVVHHAEFRTADKDLRKPVILEDVQGAEFEKVKPGE
jgi:hypothetical protein